MWPWLPTLVVEEAVDRPQRVLVVEPERPPARQPVLLHSTGAAVRDLIFRRASMIVVTTPAMQEEITARPPALSGKIQVIPNYVDTSLFAPLPESRPLECGRVGRVVYVGRLAPEKNLPPCCSPPGVEGQLSDHRRGPG